MLESIVEAVILKAKKVKDKNREVLGKSFQKLLLHASKQIY